MSLGEPHLSSTVPGERTRTDRVFAWLLTAIVALTALKASRGLSISMWGDEAITASTVSRGFSDTVDVLHEADGGFAGYSLLMNLWVWLGEPTEVWLRLPSFVAVVATITLAAILARRIAGAVSGLVAAVVLALHPDLVGVYAIEGRPYALAVLAVTGVAVIVHGASLTGLTARRIIAAGLLVAVAVSLHTLTVLAFAAMLPWLLGAVRATTWTRARTAIAAVVLAVDAGVIVVMLILAVRFSYLQSWLTNLAPRDWPDFLTTVASLPALLCVLGGAIAMAVSRRSPQVPDISRADVCALITWAIGPTVVLLVGGWLYRPMLLPRYVLSSAVAWAVLAGIAVSIAWQLAARRSWGRAAVLAAAVPVIAVVLLTPGALAHVDKPEQPREAAEWIAGRHESGDGLLYAPTWNEPALRWYLTESPDAVLGDDAPVDIAAGEATARESGAYWTPSRPELVRAVETSSVGSVFEQITEGYDRIWLVSVPGADGRWRPVPEVGTPLSEELTERWTETAESLDFGMSRVTLYTRPTA